MANNRLTAGCYRANSRLLPPASCSPPRSLPVASARSRDCTTSPPFGVNGSRKNGFVVTVSTRALNGGRGASVAACAAVAWGCARSHCSCRAPIGQLQRLCRALPSARLGS